MISKKDNYIKLDTNNTTLLFGIVNDDVVTLYYGAYLRDEGDYFQKYGNLFNTTNFGCNVGCNDCIYYRRPFSFTGDGNSTESFFIAHNYDGSYVNRFNFTGFEITDGLNSDDSFPHARNKSQSLILHYTDDSASLKMDLIYSIFDDCDAISVKSRVKYIGDNSVEILRMMSLQLDFYDTDYEILTFDGAWGKERHLNRRDAKAGIYVNDSKVGSSSNKHNPLIMLSKKRGNGEVYAFNLVYSGNHKEIVECTEDGRTHFLTGINDYLFNYNLKSGETFESPEAVMIFGETEDITTCRMHSFVKKHIIRSDFVNKERMILLNNWEATYFDFNFDKLCLLLEKAKQVGVELFVLDDGWFGKRDSDNCSLGDWHIENPKMDGRLKEFSQIVKSSGLQFGIWMEPEMINEDSELYKIHPEFVMRNGREPISRRNQLMLDLTNVDVQNYLIKVISDVIEKYEVDYIKWDYNRNMIDVFGSKLDNQGEYFYRYICGLYRVFSIVCNKYSNVLFEACASGGNRYDLGILYYMPQIWTSDNTDAYERLFIQEGTQFGYPQNTMGAHVSICPNHQTGNSIPIEDRFNVAAMGVLGYELDMMKLKETELSAIRSQILYYKKHRKLIQNGNYLKLDSVYDGNYSGSIIISEDKSEAIAFVCVKKKIMAIESYNFYFKGLDGNAMYKAEVRERIDSENEQSFVTSGQALMNGCLRFYNLFKEKDRENYSASMSTRLIYFKKQFEK